jgi:hypothetical protein
MDDSKVHEIAFPYNTYQEGLTTADATGLMVVFGSSSGSNATN